MTIERKIIVGLEDIKAVTFECDVCHSRITMNPNKAHEIPFQCAECKKSWHPLPMQTDGTIASPFFTFLDALAKLRMVGPKNAGFQILLEFEEPN